MLFLMRNLDQSRRVRQAMLVTAALIGIGALVLALASASVSVAHAATPGAEKARTLTAEDKADIEQVNAYLNGLTDLQGNFLQVGPDGSLAEGKFYLRRPGRLRFEYLPPQKTLVVADGTWVAVKDGFSAAQRYPIGSTPLSIILADKIDLNDKVRVLGVERQPGVLRVTLQDKSGDAPGSLTLVFDQPRLQLRQWMVTDAQGLQTTVALRNTRSGVRADNALFVLQDEQRPGAGKPK